MGISFDVSNAFNSLPWTVIGEALRGFGVPDYLMAVVRDYCKDRRLAYTDRDGVPKTRRLGLEVAPQKTQATVFYNRRRRGAPPEGLSLRVEGVRVPTTPYFTYLGVWLDERRSFGEHVDRVAPKTKRMANSLARILPNIGVPPIKLLAKSYAERYEAVSELRRVRGIDLPRARRALKLRAKETLLQEWKEYLAEPQHKYGRRVIEAVQPVLEEWVEGVKQRFVAFHAVQVITGHGCFGDYLHRIGKERTARCHYCPVAVDTAQHTLKICPRWEEERRVLRAAIGQDLSLSAVIATVVRPGDAGREAWRKFASFCDKVMSRKEADERVRRGEVSPPSSSLVSESDSDGGGD
ncbi:uncharacterized protein [Temnothorax nylanderi]|uniref:uncharacterized protein n=1 Tax=Temnothorax nylanderi TaxID=102681 RepID=UPI003A8C1943